MGTFSGRSQVNREAFGRDKKKPVHPKASPVKPIYKAPIQLKAGVSKCTEKIVRKFCELIEEGIPAGTVCNFLGISNTAFHNWMRRGESYNDAGEEGGCPAEHEIYGVFVRAYKKAASRYLIKRHRILHNTNDKNWYREVVILERRDKKNWSKDAPPGGNEDQYNGDEKFV